MPVNGGEAVPSEYAKLRRRRNLCGHPAMETTETNPLPTIVIPSIVQSRSSKASTIFSVLRSGNPSPPCIKKKTFSPASKFRGMGCTAAASQKVSVPSVIRASADWERRKAKKKQKKGFLSSKSQGCGDGSNFSCVVAEDAWCGPGIGFSDADSDCVVTVGRRNASAGRGRERPCISRRTINSEHLCHRHPSPEGVDEIMVLHGGIFLGDRHRGWRLDVDDMSYEQLLELGDRIGYVSTGLKEEEIGHCIRKIKISNGKCSICQEEYEEDDELGKLECGHGYHVECIKQWLSLKNRCPVCKTKAAA